MKKLITRVAVALPLAALLVFAVSADTPSFAQTQLGTEGSVEAQLNTNAEVNVDATAESTTTAESDVDARSEADSEFSFSINRSDVEAMADVDGEAVLTVEDVVETEAGFQTFVRQMMEADTQVENVDVSDDEVVITYRQNGRLLGFIPVKVATKVVVDSEGDVSVNYPWYKFATSVESDADLESQIQSRANAVLAARANASADAGAQLSSNEKILLVGEVYQVLQAELGADVSPNASAEVENDTNAASVVEVQ